MTGILSRPALRILACAGMLVAAMVPAVHAAPVAMEASAVMRARPEAMAPVVAVINPNSLVDVQRSEGAWHRVSTGDGQIGWIPGVLHASTLMPDASMGIGSLLPDKLRVAMGGPVRSRPATGAPQVFALAPRSIVSVVARLGDWAHVRVQEREGWLDLVAVPVEAASADEPPGQPVAVAPVGAGEVAAEARARREAAREQRESQGAQRQAERAAVKEQAAADRAAAAQAAAEKAAAEAAANEEADREKAAAEQMAAEEAATPSAAEQAAAAERKAQQDAERQARIEERQAREAEKRATAQAAKEVPPAAPAPERAPKPEPAADKSKDQDAHEAEREARRAEEAAGQEAARAERERAAAERRAAQHAEKQARESDKQAREVRVEQAEAAAAARGPVAPVEIPPAIPVAMGEKAPAQRPSDPASNPLVRQGAPTAASLAPPPPAAVAAGSAYAPFDAQQQLDRSVASLHADQASALGLSTGESRPATTPSVYVGPDAKAVSTSVVSQIVARVNDEILTNDEFERRVEDTLKDMRRGGDEDIAPGDELTVKRRLLARGIEQLLLIDHARVLGLPFDRVYASEKERFMKQAGIKDDQELLQLLDATGRTWSDFKRELLREAVPRALLKHEVFDSVTVDEDEIERHYRLHQEDYAEEACVRLREIVLQPRPEERTREFNLRLDRVLQRLEAGEDFCAVTRDQSEAPSADDCGLLPQCFTRSQLDDKVALIAFRLGVGDVEPIQTDWGYHVLRLEEARPRRLRPLVEVRDPIVDALRSERAGEEVRRYLDRLREAARIEVAPEYQQFLETPARSSREAAAAGRAGQ